MMRPGQLEDQTLRSTECYRLLSHDYDQQNIRGEHSVRGSDDRVAPEYVLAECTEPAMACFLDTRQAIA